MASAHSSVRAQRLTREALEKYADFDLKQEDRELMHIILYQLQELLKGTNPYIKDFKMICEIPEDDLLDGQLVIRNLGVDFSSVAAWTWTLTWRPR